MKDVDKFRLIEEVRKRPLLWDCRIHQRERTREKCDQLWSEIAKILYLDPLTCMMQWKRLRSQFCSEANRIPIRIKRAKETGVYNPRIKYYIWSYFDALRFIISGLSHQAQFKSIFADGSNIEIEDQNNINQEQVQMLKNFKDYPSKNGSDTELEILEASNSDQTQSANVYDDSDNDVEFIESNSSDSVQFQSENYFQNSSNAYSALPINISSEGKKEDASFKSYTISLCEVTPGSECTAILSDCDVLPNDSALREELEFHFSATGNDKVQVHTPELSGCSREANSAVAPNQEDYNPSISSNQLAFQSTDTSDQDYSFLYSFLSQTKLMTSEQKAGFYESMKSLLYIFPAVSAAELLEKQLLLPEYEDLDEKFLLGFWPFMKTMTLLQNIQFRLKVTEIIFKILFTESNSFTLQITNSV